MSWLPLEIAPVQLALQGGLWLLAGVVYSAFKTRGFRERPLLFDFRET